MDDKMPENLEEIETSYEEALEKKMPQPRNRAERRALRKKVGANKYDAITEMAKKLTYVDLINKLREKNEKENNENEGTTEDN